MKSRFCETVARKRTAAEALGQFGSCFKLLAGEASAQHGGSNIAKAGLALRMNAGVIAENIVGHLLQARRATA